MFATIRTKITVAIVAAAVLSLGMMSVSMPNASAQEVSPQAGICEGANTLQFSSSTPVDSCEGLNGDAETKVNELVTTVINIFSVVVGIVAVIMIIVGGLKYITSGGDSAKVTAAKNSIIYAIIGLVIVALAQVIVRFVLAKATTVS